VQIDLQHDPHRWWDVIDRTTGAVVTVEDWDFVNASLRGASEAASPTSLRGGAEGPDAAIQEATQNQGDSSGKTITADSASVQEATPDDGTRATHMDEVAAIAKKYAASNPQPWAGDHLTSGTGAVLIRNAQPYHEYTVSFLVYDIWEPVQMYNHLTNDWGDHPHDPSLDNFHPGTRAHMLAALKAWLAANPKTTVIRFTTFFYQFSLVFNDLAKEKYVDWFGYASTVSPAALDAFEKQYGYRLRPEDFVDEGYYNTYFRTPGPRWLDWLEFVRNFVRGAAREFVDVVHADGREAMMFLGDQWIGMEPYAPGFEKIGLDAVVGSVGNGATMRMIADIPGVKYTEGRLLPYFFPDVFNENGDPAGEAAESWRQARRAMLQHPVDRIGYGGYPSLAARFPDFVKVAEQVAAEFRQIHDRRGSGPKTLPKKVGILNYWGKIRTWQTHMVAHALAYRVTEPYVGIIEALSGLPVDIEWLSFEDVRNGVPEGIGVLINAGTAGTAFSGGDVWADPRLTTAIRSWVDAGGCFIGVGEPTALVRGGRTFQLADVLGVDQEVSFSLSSDKYWESRFEADSHEHFVTAGAPQVLDTGERARNVYALEGSFTRVLRATEGDVQLALNRYGSGRSAYLAGLPYTPENSRLLHRLLLWGMGLATPAEPSHETPVEPVETASSIPWLPDNPQVEATYFPDTGWCAIVNNTADPQQATLATDSGSTLEVSLTGSELRWEHLESR
jgi:1,3-beta-galactosyl-N-acetylhexosamine phosphorylase